MIYNKDGTAISAAYDYQGVSVSAAYDVDGNPLFRDFANSTTVSSVYTSTLTSQPQGGCMDGSGNICTCFYTAGMFSRYNMTAGTETTTSFTSEAYGHANGMTYNPNTGYLYIAGQKDTGEVYILSSSFELIDTVNLTNAGGTAFNCWNIAYDRIAQRFITMSGGTIYFFDDSFDLDDTESYDTSDWPSTRQDIETDGAYIYALSYDTNYINVFDMSGTLVKQITNTGFTGEPESLIYDWANNAFYMEGKDSYYVIRSVVF